METIESMNEQTPQQSTNTVVNSGESNGFNMEIFNGFFTNDFVKILDDNMEKAKIDITNDKYNQINNLKDEVFNIQTHVCREFTNLRMDLENVFDEKLSTLNKLVKEMKMLKEYYDRTTNKNLQNDIKKMAEKLIYCIGNILKMKAYYEKCEPVKGVEIGKMIIPPFENPIGEQIVDLEFVPKKIVANDDGFYCTSESRLSIIDIEKKQIVLSNTFAIGDISITYDGKLAFIAHSVSAIPAVFIYSNSTHCFKELTLIDQLNKTYTNYLPYFHILKDDLVLYDTEYKLSMKSNRTRLLSKCQPAKIPEDSKIIDNVLYETTEVGSYISATSDDRKAYITCYIGKRQISVVRNLINELNKGKFLLSTKCFIFIVDPSENSAEVYETQTIFGEEYLVSYRMTEEEVIFCLGTSTNEKLFKFRRYFRRCICSE
ncbi:unnamed protein product [Dimorphilus gyrociliatus]|uniref:Uncharacterized protein n=1 Tax=Dimorphilus gyrociliatus TaxID=2664684 RepID=A0A7I8VJ13_9ANNE|nr:unnamed protein product [Dimorphilus gyrociliatus]